MNRFFRVPNAAVYEAGREGMDAAFGNPGPYADTCLPPVESAPKDEQERVYLAVLDTMLQWPVAQDQFNALAQQGLVDEVLPEDYWACFPPSQL